MCRRGRAPERCGTYRESPVCVLVPGMHAGRAGCDSAGVLPAVSGQEVQVEAHRRASSGKDVGAGCGSDKAGWGHERGANVGTADSSQGCLNTLDALNPSCLYHSHLVLVIPLTEL